RERFGFNVDNSSPNFTGLHINEELNKSYEPAKSFTDITLYPIVDPANNVSVGLDTVGLATNVESTEFDWNVFLTILENSNLSIQIDAISLMANDGTLVP